MMFILFSIDNHTIAVVNMPEKYDLLEAALDPVLSEIKELMALKVVQVGGKSYELEFYLGGRSEGNEPTLIMLSLTFSLRSNYSFCYYFWGLPRPTLSIPAFGVWYRQVIGMVKYYIFGCIHVLI